MFSPRPVPGAFAPVETPSLRLGAMANESWPGAGNVCRPKSNNGKRVITMERGPERMA